MACLNQQVQFNCLTSLGGYWLCSDPGMACRSGDRDKDGKLAGQLEEAAQAVKYVYSQCPSYDQLIPALLNHPVSVSLLLHIPL